MTARHDASVGNTRQEVGRVLPPGEPSVQAAFGRIDPQSGGYSRSPQLRQRYSETHPPAAILDAQLTAPPLRGATGKHFAELVSSDARADVAGKSLMWDAGPQARRRGDVG
jgi:hypothetical protein